jgi:hypothetical protein
MVESRYFIQNPYKDSEEWIKVTFIAEEILKYLNQPEILKKLEEANKPNISSGIVQNVFLGKASELGFKDESNGLFNEYLNKKLRPDYFLQLGNTGILMEVERGKTNDNNMDFLDFWKCHICNHAHYLFLCVPKVLRQNESTNSIKKPYQKVVNNMESFFLPENYTNVRGLVVIGY